MVCETHVAGVTYSHELDSHSFEGQKSDIKETAGLHSFHRLLRGFMPLFQLLEATGIPWCTMTQSHHSNPGLHFHMAFSMYRSQNFFSFSLIRIHMIIFRAHPMDLTEAEDIKKRCQEYTEELYKKDFHNPDITMV